MAALTGELFQAGEQLVLAVEAAVGFIFHVIRVLELGGGDELVPETAGLGVSGGVALVGLRDGRGIGGNGDGVLPQRLAGGPGQERRIGSAGIGHQDLAEFAEKAEQLLLLRVEARRVEFRAGRSQSHQPAHIHDCNLTGANGPPQPVRHRGSLPNHSHLISH